MERCIICGEEAKRSLSDKPMRISKFLSDPIFRYAIRGIEMCQVYEKADNKDGIVCVKCGNGLMRLAESVGNGYVFDFEKIDNNEADENVSVSEVEDKQEDISDIDTDTNVEAGAEDKPEEITVKQEKKGFAEKLFHKKDKGEKKPVSKSKEKKKSKFYELKAQYKKVKPYIPMGWKYFKKLLKAIRFTDTRIVLDVGKEDAYEAAMLYGKVQAGLINTIAILAGVFTVKLKKADVNCIFDEKKFGYDVHTLVRVRPSTLIAIGFCTGVNFLKIYLSGRCKKKRAAKRRSKELAAKKNEVKATN